METKFTRVRSLKDIVIFSIFIIAGILLTIIPEAMGANIGGYTLIIIGVILSFVLKSAYRNNASGVNYLHREITFKREVKESLVSAVKAHPEKIVISAVNDGQSLKLEIYYNKKTNKAFIQLFEYIPHQYEPCTDIFEYEFGRIEKLIK